jgi:anti-anti-sigma factor
MVERQHDGSPMIIGEDTHDRTHLLVLDGRLDASTCGALAERLDALIGTGITRVVLDCEKLTHVSSVGLRVLLVGAKKAKAGGGALVCCRLQPMVREVFDLSGFGAVLAVYADRAAALRALEPTIAP